MGPKQLGNSFAMSRRHHSLEARWPNTEHALRQMARREIQAADVEAVLRNPSKMEPAEEGATNYWGLGPSGYRVRVTVNPDGSIKTVAWADRRK